MSEGGVCGYCGGDDNGRCFLGDDLTLTDFLLARIAEDERIAVHGGRPSPRRVAECAAKRRIVKRAAMTLGSDARCGSCSQHSWASWTLGCLAAPYADHPDYREEWKP